MITRRKLRGQEVKADSVRDTRQTHQKKSQQKDAKSPPTEVPADLDGKEKPAGKVGKSRKEVEELGGEGDAFVTAVGEGEVGEEDTPLPQEPVDCEIESENECLPEESEWKDSALKRLTIRAKYSARRESAQGSRKHLCQTASESRGDSIKELDVASVKVKGSARAPLRMANLPAVAAASYKFGRSAPRDSLLKPQALVEMNQAAGGLLKWLLFAALLSLVIVPIFFTFEFHNAKSASAKRVSLYLEELRTSFPSQRPELWKRTRIHLEHHLHAKQPSQPVSLILTAGRRAERTLRCLADRIAGCFANASRALFVRIDGAAKASLAADQAKLELDQELEDAFKSGRAAAAVHRLEELPPASAFILYKYCDHENAPYRHPLLLFTVLLSKDEVAHHLSLLDVEEAVSDHLRSRFLVPGRRVAFDSMDEDKLGGLWSRISHLVLPVSAEKRVESDGCQG